MKASKVIALILAVCMTIGMIACGGSAPSTAAATTNNAPAAAATEAPKAAEPAAAEPQASEAEPAEEPAAPAFDWTTYTDWIITDWDSKDIAYQFTGEWALAEYGISFQFLINLYGDGSAVVDQRNIAGSSYWQYGYWSEENTEDGNEIAFDTLYVVDLNGELAAHEYSYTLYEEADGNYSFGYTFGIAPGMYFRDADVAGGKEVKHASFDEFHAAVDVVEELYRFVSTDPNDMGVTIVISIYSNNTVNVGLEMDPYGQINHKDGSFVLSVDENSVVSYAISVEDAEIALVQNEDGSFADFEFSYDASALQPGLVVSSNMTQTEVPAGE